MYWVYVGPVQSKAEWSWRTKTLIACSLVCREWRDYAQTYLSTPIEVSYEELSSFSDTVRRDRRILPGITRLDITKKFETIPISPFVIQHQLRRLHYLNIDELNLAREHRWLHRAPLFHSVRELRLHRLQSCDLSQLVRFINAFPFLSSLTLDFAFNGLQDNGQILPKPCHINTRSLTWLELDPTPGLSRLIDWFLNAKPFLTRLRTLILCVCNIEDEDDFRSSFEGVERLLDHCRGSVEDLRLQLSNVPIVESVSDLGVCIFLESEFFLMHIHFF